MYKSWHTLNLPRLNTFTPLHVLITLATGYFANSDYSVMIWRDAENTDIHNLKNTEYVPRRSKRPIVDLRNVLKNVMNPDKITHFFG